MSPVNECIPYFEPGGRITASAEAAVTGKRFVDISGDVTAEGLYQVSPATAKGMAFGVASHDAAEGEWLTVLVGNYVVPVTAAAAIEAGEEVEVGAEGKVAKLGAEGRAVGRALAKTAEGKDCPVLLYTSNPA